MNEKLEFKDDFIKDFVKKGSRTIANKSFENVVMQNIYDTVAYKKEVAAKLKKSMYFFCTALAMISAYISITILNKMGYYNAASLITILASFFVIAIGILVLSNYKRLLHSFSF